MARVLHGYGPPWSARDLARVGDDPGLAVAGVLAGGRLAAFGPDVLDAARGGWLVPPTGAAAGTRRWAVDGEMLAVRAAPTGPRCTGSRAWRLPPARAWARWRWRRSHGVSRVRGCARSC